jgi:hypothetical protein
LVLGLFNITSPEIRKTKAKSNNKDSLVLSFEITKVVEEHDSIKVQVSKKIGSDED